MMMYVLHGFLGRWSAAQNLDSFQLPRRSLLLRDSQRYCGVHHVSWYNMGVCYFYLSHLDQVKTILSLRGGNVKLSCAEFDIAPCRQDGVHALVGSLHCYDIVRTPVSLVAMVICNLRARSCVA